MGNKLTNAPVYYTLAQVQFNPILDLDVFIPSIQAEMRKAGFPDFRNEVQQQFAISMGAGQLTTPPMTQQVRYMFGNINATSHFILDHNGLILQSTDYASFENFSGMLLRALKMLNDVLALQFVERVGLRYLNAVQPNPGESLGDYLTPGVLGIQTHDGWNLQQSFTEVGFNTPVGQLISRVIIREGQIGIPMELTSLAPAIAPRFMDKYGLHAIMDNDCFSIHREGFILASIDERMRALHAEIEKSFQATVTAFALKTWS
ncbi:TPA: TIGR04255 family protein [Aeromonas hydrophila]|uniref:TIGR04255 family protein n=1 Tax=Aeromonas hydrophila TaxID=644 RepID=UPI0005CE5777|nr:TIGR04255 family protein [Aeromonas hydrophila]AJQ56049.1 hypothetical protein RY45_18930 [Aeromonas hydrophila]HAU4885611.1 TIGR04255 family protein [Aeromonas hydrophila]